MVNLLIDLKLGMGLQIQRLTSMLAGLFSPTHRIKAVWTVFDLPIHGVRSQIQAIGLGDHAIEDHRLIQNCIVHQGGKNPRAIRMADMQLAQYGFQSVHRMKQPALQRTGQRRLLLQ